MNVTVRSIHFDADVKLTGFIQEKLSKLLLFHDNIIAAEVFLRLEHDGDNNENKIVDIKLVLPGRELFAKRQSRTFEEASMNTVEALRSQLVRTKERLRAAS
jgi:putative sigma-54 modulation protein